MSTATEHDIDELLNDTQQMDAVLRHAVFQALETHKRAGNPVAVWRDGKVIWIRPEDIPGVEKTE